MELKPCRSCGAPCRVEHFGATAILESCDFWICSKHVKLGGECHNPAAYLNADAWNTRSPDPRIAELEAMILQLGANAAEMAKHYQAEPGLTKEDYETIYGWGGQG